LQPTTDDGRGKRNAVQASHPDRICCVNLTAARCGTPRSRPLPETAVTSASGSGSALAQRPRTKGALTADRASPVAVPPCETVSEEAATPGVTRNACTFWEPLRRFILLILLRVRHWGTTRNRLSGKTAAEPALLDHWRRVIHACSDCTFSRGAVFINSKVRHPCAKPVEDGTCLWMVAEKLVVIGVIRAVVRPSLSPPI